MPEKLTQDDMIKLLASPLLAPPPEMGGCRIRFSGIDNSAAKPAAAAVRILSEEFRWRQSGQDAV